MANHNIRLLNGNHSLRDRHVSQRQKLNAEKWWSLAQSMERGPQCIMGGEELSCFSEEDAPSARFHEIRQIIFDI